MSKKNKKNGLTAQGVRDLNEILGPVKSLGRVIIMPEPEDDNEFEIDEDTKKDHKKVNERARTYY